MDQRDLKPASELAKVYGVKAVVYGSAGSGKTPIGATAPRPLMLAVEPGLLSMRNSNVPTYSAFTYDKVDEFFKWLFSSNEVKNFDTIIVDSTSQLCDIFLQEADKKGIKHGLAQYGHMGERVYDILYQLYYMQNKHTYLIAKEEIKNINNAAIKRPYYQGQFLPIQVPHLFDFILRLGKYPIPRFGEQIAFRCVGSFDEIARNRTGNLAEFEPPDFNALIRKAMS